MREEVETYSWDKSVFKKLKDSMVNKEYVGVGLYSFGTIISVEKKYQKDDTPYIEVIYQIND